jgi:lipopolysaccharide/colanic/teichoic acid biosynthesis glycosyltransferase
MLDWSRNTASVALAQDDASIVSEAANGGSVYRFCKRGFDIVTALALLPGALAAALLLMVLNPFFNPGPLFYVQQRMGRDCHPFWAFKFRSMRCTKQISRGAFDDLEQDRITRLGCLLRRSRVDELPQLLNVLLGQMSMIGPRPDYYPHALVYLKSVPGYRLRCRLRPGISGLAQVRHGYVMGPDAVQNKVWADLEYAQKAGFRLDTWIAWRTLVVVLCRHGA